MRIISFADKIHTVKNQVLRENIVKVIQILIPNHFTRNRQKSCCLSSCQKSFCPLPNVTRNKLLIGFRKYDSAQFTATNVPKNAP